jgi:hypothetical protein
VWGEPIFRRLFLRNAGALRRAWLVTIGITLNHYLKEMAFSSPLASDF